MRLYFSETNVIKTIVISTVLLRISENFTFFIEDVKMKRYAHIVSTNENNPGK